MAAGVASRRPAASVAIHDDRDLCSAQVRRDVEQPIGSEPADGEGGRAGQSTELLGDREGAVGDVEQGDPATGPIAATSSSGRSRSSLAATMP
jgi:hypothetical protein